VSKYNWKDRNCLVTGGAGFGGSHLCEQLLDRGARVYVLDRYMLNNSYLVLSGNSKRIQFIRGDIRDLDFIKLTFDKLEIETVFHLAAQPIVPISNQHPFETLSVNALGTYSILEAVRTSGAVKGLIFASSGAYYGTTTTPDKIKETAPPLPTSNIYATSKVAADVAVQTYARVYNMSAAVCRFINTYGPGDTNFSRIIPWAVKNLITDPEGPYDFGSRSDGTGLFDCLYIADMANAYIKMAENLDKISGEVFNFCGDQLHSARELTELVSECFDGRKRDAIFSGQKAKKQTIKRLDTTKAQQLLDWTPQTTLEQGLKSTLAWYRQYWDRL